MYSSMHIVLCPMKHGNIRNLSKGDLRSPDTHSIYSCGICLCYTRSPNKSCNSNYTSNLDILPTDLPQFSILKNKTILNIGEKNENSCVETLRLSKENDKRIFLFWVHIWLPLSPCRRVISQGERTPDEEAAWRSAGKQWASGKSS